MAESELKAPVLALAQTLKEKFVSPEYIPGCKIIDITDINEYTTDNGWIQAFCGQHNNQRVRYRGFPAGLAVDDYVDVMHFPDRKTFEVQGNGGTVATGLDAVKVSKVWESDGGTIALQADAVGDISITSKLFRAGDPDTHVVLTDDKIDIVSGGVTFITLDENAIQDELIINENNVDFDVRVEAGGVTNALFIEGSSGNIGLRVGAPSARFDIGDGAIEFTEMTAPGAGTVNTATLFCQDDGAGTTELAVRFNTGSIQILRDANGDSWQDGSITIGTDVIHEGDPDTKLSFVIDGIEAFAGGLSMLKLTETTQDLIEIGDVAGGGDVDINLNNGQMFIEGSTGNVSVGTTTVSDDFQVQGKSGVQASVGLYTGDGDGTDNNTFAVYLLGTPGSITNRERLLLQGLAGDQFRFRSDAAGTGTLRPLIFETGTNTSQIYLDTNGNVGIGITPSTRLDIDAGAMEFSEMTAPGGGAANTCRIYTEDNGAGKTRLMAIFNTGAAQQIAIEP